MRRWLRWGLVCGLRACGALSWARRGLVRQGGIVVLALHRVLAEEAWRRTCSLPSIRLRRATFERLARFLAELCEPVNVEALDPARPSPRVRVAVTFDDGWWDNDAVAFPVARSFGIPVTVFVCPGLMGRITPFWHERVAAALKAEQPRISARRIAERIEDLKRHPEGIPEELKAPSPADALGADGFDRTMSWEQLAAWSQDGVTVGAHSQTHPILTQIAESDAAREILRSRLELEQKLGRRCRLFSYPNGNYSERVRELVARSGFERALTMDGGAWTASTDPFAIPRVNVAEDDVTTPWGAFSPAMVEYVLFWRPWRALRRNSR